MKRLGGRFIVFDGGEGCGKSTQARLLREKLEAAGQAVTLVRDPGSTAIGEKIRQILLNPDHSEMSMRCEMLLYMAARAQMMHEHILPALARGDVVLCDRFVSSTLAYQLGGDGVTDAEIRAVAEIALRGRWPDLTLIFDMPVAASRERVRAKFEHRSQTLFGEQVEIVKDRIESRPEEYHLRVRENYLAQARREPHRYRVIDGARSIEQVHADVVAAVEQMDWEAATGKQAGSTGSRARRTRKQRAQR
ncbi:MAG: dTMP kinase [Phycisphaerae bacterium]|nr:dTMP kinase [Phycisphaerae bacterium]MDW8261901.1 dTMP kinase [Phycisphaerales bacterium]